MHLSSPRGFATPLRLVCSLLVTCGLIAAGCGGGSGDDDSEESRRVDVSGGVCSLLTDNDVEAFIAPFSERELGSASGQQGGNCIWELKEFDDGVGVTLEVDPLTFWATDIDDYGERIIAGQFGDFATVDDLGDAAWIPVTETLGGLVNSVNVVTGDNVVVVSAFFLDIEPGSEASDALVALTRIAVDNLTAKLG